MKFTLEIMAGERMNVTMPPPEVLYTLARRLKARAKAVPDTWGSDSTQESLSNKLNDMGNKILVANGGR